jgi:hypothetical protein
LEGKKIVNVKRFLIYFLRRGGGVEGTYFISKKSVLPPSYRAPFILAGGKGHRIANLC